MWKKIQPFQRRDVKKKTQPRLFSPILFLSVGKIRTPNYLLIHQQRKCFVLFLPLTYHEGANFIARRSSSPCKLFNKMWVVECIVIPTFQFPLAPFVLINYILKRISSGSKKFKTHFSYWAEFYDAKGPCWFDLHGKAFSSRGCSEARCNKQNEIRGASLR